MKKRIVLLFTSLFVFTIFAMGVKVEAVETNHIDKADVLKELGLFQGTTKGYELDRVPTRAEGAVMLVRLLGKEADAQENKHSHSFEDVPVWATAYVGYLYANGITNGINEKHYGSSDELNAQQYATFILRALGYDDKNGDFSWNTALEALLERAILTQEEYNQLSKKQFLRDDTVLLSYNALNSSMKNGELLLDHLKNEKVISENQIVASLINGPVKLELQQLSEVRTVVNSLYQASIYVNTSALSDKMKAFHALRVVKFNEKSEAEQFGKLLNDKNSTNGQIEDRADEITQDQNVYNYSSVVLNDVRLHPGSSYSSTDPAFDAYLFLLYYDNKDRIYGYSEYYVPYDTADQLLDKLNYPIKLTDVPRLDNIYRVENHIAEKWEGDQIYRAYRFYKQHDNIEDYQRQYGEIMFMAIMSTLERFDLETTIDNKILTEKSRILRPFTVVKSSIPEVSGSTTPANYRYEIYFDYNYNVIGYTEIELPQKPL